MNFLFSLIFNLYIGINFKFCENMPSEIIQYQKEKIFDFFKGYNLKEIQEFPEKNVFELKELEFLLKIDFEEYDFEENYAKTKCNIRVFDIKGKRIYEKDFDKSLYIEENIYPFLDFLNYSIFSFLSQIFPPVLEIKDIRKNLFLISNPHFPEISKLTWIKIFDEKNEPIAYLKVVDIKDEEIYARCIYSKGKLKKGLKGILSYLPSNESGISLSFSSIFLKAISGDYGKEKNIKGFEEFKYGFDLGIYYKWISLSLLNLNISFYPVLNFNLWDIKLGLLKGFNLKKFFLFTGGEIGTFIGSQKAENGINVTSLSFAISPSLKFELPIFENLSFSSYFSYPFSQSLNSFWYERKGGTEYVPDSILIYKDVKIKGPNIKISINYKFNKFEF
ncbi:MAG: hypothetical protein ABIM29_01250 [candidate division WOR-3 bacterium]